MNTILMYVMPPVIGVAIGTAWGLIERKRSRARLAALVEERTAQLRADNDHLREANMRLAEETITDSLTGALNRRFLAAHLERESPRILRLRESHYRLTPGNAVLVVDIDDFKEFNDRHGRVRGDEVLVRFAEILRRVVRSSDHVVRWGGDEFVVLAAEANPDDSVIVANRILKGVRERRNSNRDDAFVTCSIGISHFPFFPDHARALDWQQVLQLAHLAAYLARRAGKDGWFSVRGRRFDPAFRFDLLQEQMSGAPGDLYLDRTLAVGHSNAMLEERAAAAPRSA